MANVTVFERRDGKALSRKETLFGVAIALLDDLSKPHYCHPPDSGRAVLEGGLQRCQTPGFGVPSIKMSAGDALSSGTGESGGDDRIV